MKQVIIIRKDLKMRRGKEIAQGSHASSQVIIDAGFMGNDRAVSKVSQWLDQGMRKICVQVNSEKELIDIWTKGQDAGVFSHIIQDAGATEFDGVPTYTAVALGPDEDEIIDTITKHLILY